MRRRGRPLVSAGISSPSPTGSAMRPVPPADRRWRRSLLAAALAAGLAAGTVVVATPAVAAPSPARAAGPDLATGGVHAPVPRSPGAPCTGEGLEGHRVCDRPGPARLRPAERPQDQRRARPATRPTTRAGRIGSLFINPGGPGGSGVDFVPAAQFLYRPEVLARFDIVGRRPARRQRGAHRCAASARRRNRTEFFADLPFFPVGAPGDAGVPRRVPGLHPAVRAVAGPIIDHVSTANFVRDLDLLRQAVGDPGFTFVGYSYGSIRRRRPTRRCSRGGSGRS